MKIAILTSGIMPVPAVRGGAVENLIDFCLEYNDRHRLHDITIYSVADKAALRHPALRSTVNHYRYIDVSSLWAKIRKHLRHRLHRKEEYYNYTVEDYLHEAIKDLKRNTYDIVLVENRPGYVLRLKNTIKARLVIHQENDYINTHIARYQEIYEAATLIINTSDYITRQVQTIRADDTKCVTVLNGIDVARFEKAQPLDRSSTGLSEQDFVIVFSGRLTPEKGILQLIQAMARLTIPRMKLLIIGASAYGKDPHPTPFIKKLEEASAPIKEHVVFTGFIDYLQVPAYLKMGDIAVVPSMWEEPFGLTVVEAMASGLPLITTNSGGIPEICTGVATIVDRADIVQGLATAILNLYQHPEKRQSMSEASLIQSKYYNKQRYAEDFFRALEI